MSPKLSYIFKSTLCIFKSINEGSQGFTNPEFMEFGGVGPSHNKQNNSPELLNLLFKHISHENDPTSAKSLLNSCSMFQENPNVTFLAFEEEC